MAKLVEISTCVHSTAKNNGQGVGIVSSLTTFDREDQQEYYLPIIIQDSGDPVLTGTSTLTVIIGDVNDNRMAAGATDIQVYKLQVSAIII